ncbi:MAG: MIP family channel protein [Candidatus Bathyarchaeia archaeon]
MVKSWQKYLAELIGTYALVFFGPLSVTIYAVVLGITQPYYFGPGLFAIGTSFGAIVAIMIYALGHISGTHINPAVTISLLAIKKIDVKDAVAYIIMQLIGAALAGFTHAAILPQGKAVSFGLTLPGDAIGKSEVAAVVVEIILTFFLLFTIMGAAVDKRAPPGFAGLIIGAVVALDIYVGGPLTGASMNPARTFGPAIASGNWTAHWVYWVGPIVGGLIATLIYEYLLTEK